MADNLRLHQTYARTGKVPGVGGVDGSSDELLQHDHRNNPFKEGPVHRKPHLHDRKRGIPQHDGGFHHLPDHGPVNKSMADEN